MLKEIDPQIYGYDSADLLQVLEDGSVSASLINTSTGEIGYDFSFPAGNLPFTLTTEELEQLTITNETGIL